MRFWVLFINILHPDRRFVKALRCPVLSHSPNHGRGWHRTPCLVFGEVVVFGKRMPCRVPMWPWPSSSGSNQSCVVVKHQKNPTVSYKLVGWRPSLLVARSYCSKVPLTRPPLGSCRILINQPPRPLQGLYNPCLAGVIYSS